MNRKNIYEKIKYIEKNEIESINFELDNEKIDKKEYKKKVSKIKTEIAELKELLSVTQDNELEKVFRKVIEYEDFEELEDLKKETEKAEKAIKKECDLILDFEEYENEYEKSLSEEIIDFPLFCDKSFFFKKQSLITIAARPGVGKSAFLLNICEKLLLEDKNRSMLYYSLEMTRQEIAHRFYAMICNIDINKFYRKELNKAERETVAEINEIYKQKNGKIIVADKVSNKFEEFEEYIKEMQKKHKFDIIFVDYLTLLRKEKAINKNLEIEEIVNRLKQIAIENNTCIVVLAQLNRDVEKRTEKRLNLADLRDSGGIEQASDIVCFLSRKNEEKEEEKEEKKYQKNEVIINFEIAKNRIGRCDNFNYYFDLSKQKIRDIK